MIDFIKQLHLGMMERVRSPLAFSIVLSLVAWNWKAVLIVFSLSVPVVVKIWLIRSYSDVAHSLMFPVLSGLAIGIMWPFLALIGAWFAKLPKFLIYSIEQREGTRREAYNLHVAAERLKNKADFERARAQLEERIEVGIIQRGERLKRAAETNEATEKEILDVRKENSTDVPAWAYESGPVHVAGRYVLRYLGDANEAEPLPEIAARIEKYLSPKDLMLFGSGKRLETEVEEAIRKLIDEGAARDLIRSGRMCYELTSKGYQLRDVIIELGE